MTWRPLFACVSVALLAALAAPACSGNARLIPYNGTYGFKVVLENNPAAADPTWQQVKDFLASDGTDERDYVPGDFVCGSFAQDVHNNAEKAGIRAAWVAIELEGKPIGHALNAFNTTDHGLVFTDSTGDAAAENRAALLRPELEQDGSLQPDQSRDRVAYVQKGSELGFISLSLSPLPEYAFFRQYQAGLQQFRTQLDTYNSRVDAYNLDVQAFNSWIQGRRLTRGSTEATRAEQWSANLETNKSLLKAQEAELVRAQAELGPVWKAMGTVAGIDIRW